jgi:hypothetical protein
VAVADAGEGDRAEARLRRPERGRDGGLGEGDVLEPDLLGTVMLRSLRNCE